MNFGASLSTKSLSNPEIWIFKGNYVVYSLCLTFLCKMRHREFYYINNCLNEEPIEIKWSKSCTHPIWHTQNKVISWSTSECIVNNHIPITIKGLSDVHYIATSVFCMQRRAELMITNAHMHIHAYTPIHTQYYDNFGMPDLRTTEIILSTQPELRKLRESRKG